MLVTEFPRTTVFRPAPNSDLNDVLVVLASEAMLLLLIVTSVNSVQPSKAFSEMLVKPSGIVIEVMLLQLANALSAMLVTLSGITVLEHARSNLFVAVSIIALQLFLES